MTATTSDPADAGRPPVAGAYRTALGLLGVVGVLLFSSCGFQVGPTDPSPLMRAAERLEEDRVAELLREGADPNGSDDTVTVLGAAAIVTAPHSSVYTPDEVAAQMRIIDMLLEAGADPNISVAGENALQAGSRSAAPEVLDLLLRAGADPCVHDRPSELAKRSGNSASVGLLREAESSC